MTWTWSSTSISTDLAKVRHLIGDTDTDDQLLTDEQINFELTENTNVYIAAANCCERILAVLARRIDRNGPAFGASRSQMFTHYKDLAQSLRDKATSLCRPQWTELSQDAKETIEDDSDFELPAFDVTRDDNNG